MELTKEKIAEWRKNFNDFRCFTERDALDHLNTAVLQQVGELNQELLRRDADLAAAQERERELLSRLMNVHAVLSGAKEAPAQGFDLDMTVALAAAAQERIRRMESTLRTLRTGCTLFVPNPQGAAFIEEIDAALIPAQQEEQQ